MILAAPRAVRGSPANLFAARDSPTLQTPRICGPCSGGFDNVERIAERYSFDCGYVEALQADDPAAQRHFAGYFRELPLIKIRRRVPSADVAGDLVR